ncbi:hypothetical protein WICMUC_002848 [Wickerhamomyces mucosus]|uniref:Peptidase M48 domain-containing protein n=1 Tax=Wickerhamomyces mucosus TaxID=1378264 RepID=A0A9P8TDD9_9ASCO|nr:hypothetical protein WICMUC_002848 [Wickerhamomyces mucosus]
MFKSSIINRFKFPIATKLKFPNFKSNNFIKNYATYTRFNNKISSSNLLYDPTSRRYLGIFIGVCGLIYISNLHEAPVSGRYRFIWTPEWLEKKIGDYSYNQLYNQYQIQGKILPSNHPTTIKIAGIFKRILKVSPIDENKLDWKIHIINDPNAPPNAFVLPGGKVFVFSSILNICQNDDGLATVLSHEFAHQLARHTGENLSKTPFYSAISVILYTLTGADIFNRLIVNAIFTMPASRQMETEADYIGLMLMSKACFNPDESYKLWERMAQFEKNLRRGLINAEFLSTHPASERRIQNMIDWLPEARKERENSNCFQYNQFIDLPRFF